MKSWNIELKLALMMLALGTRSFCFAHDPDSPEHAHEHPPVKVPDAIAHRPTAIPDRIILTWNGNPASSQAVTWRTDVSVTKAVSQIAIAEGGPYFASRAKTIGATTQPLATDLGIFHCHSSVFTNLAPKTTYAYRVGDGLNWSEWFQFNTASTTAEPFAFIYFGDAQNDIKSLWSRVIRGAYSDAPKARFILHAGDLVNRANADAEWGEWHAAGGWVNGMIPSVPTPGNHEYQKVQTGSTTPTSNSEKPQPTKTITQLSAHWRPQFTLPENGPKGLEESVYFLDYQGTRIVSMNSNESREIQVTWLREVLQKNPNRWTIVTLHHPIYSAAKDRDNKELRDLWQPIFDEFKIDLVLQGHDHTYARSGLRVYDNTKEGARVNNGGTVYVVSVSGPKMYNLQKQDWILRGAEDTQLYQIIHVEKDRLRFEAKTATGELYDAFELIKQDGKANTLIEKIPATPERHRPAVQPGSPKAKAKPVGLGTD